MFVGIKQKKNHQIIIMPLEEMAVKHVGAIDMTTNWILC